jgi:hypothetical protein
MDKPHSPADRQARFRSLALTVGGSITCIIGVAHIFMPTLGYDQSVPQAMAPAVRAHFYYLGTYAICGFLLSLGLLSLYFARFAETRHALVVCTVLAFFWTARTILEILYPVDLRLFVLASPHLALLVVITFLALTYTAATVAGWRSR